MHIRMTDVCPFFGFPLSSCVSLCDMNERDAGSPVLCLVVSDVSVKTVRTRFGSRLAHEFVVGDPSMHSFGITVWSQGEKEVVARAGYVLFISNVKCNIFRGELVGNIGVHNIKKSVHVSECENSSSDRVRLIYEWAFSKYQHFFQSPECDESLPTPSALCNLRDHDHVEGMVADILHVTVRPSGEKELLLSSSTSKRETRLVITREMGMELGIQAGVTNWKIGISHVLASANGDEVLLHLTPFSRVVVLNKREITLEPKDMEYEETSSLYDISNCQDSGLYRVRCSLRSFHFIDRDMNSIRSNLLDVCNTLLSVDEDDGEKLREMLFFIGCASCGARLYPDRNGIYLCEKCPIDDVNRPQVGWLPAKVSCVDDSGHSVTVVVSSCNVGEIFFCSIDPSCCLQNLLSGKGRSVRNNLAAMCSVIIDACHNNEVLDTVMSVIVERDSNSIVTKRSTELIALIFL